MAFTQVFIAFLLRWMVTLLSSRVTRRVVFLHLWKREWNLNYIPSPLSLGVLNKELSFWMMIQIWKSRLVNFYQMKLSPWILQNLCFPWNPTGWKPYRGPDASSYFYRGGNKGRPSNKGNAPVSLSKYIRSQLVMALVTLKLLVTYSVKGSRILYPMSISVIIIELMC